MESKAQSVLLRYRALNSKASELRNMVMLPIKRDHKLFNPSPPIEGLSPAQVSEIVEHLLGYISATPQQGLAPLKSLESTLKIARQHLTERERDELIKHIFFVVNEYAAMEEKLETAIKKAL